MHDNDKNYAIMYQRNILHNFFVIRDKEIIFALAKVTHTW